MRFKTFSNPFPNCDSIRNQFSEYLDGVLSEEVRLRIHEHLGFCRECGDHLDDLCKTLSILADFREECLPASIRDYRLPRSTFIEIFPSIRMEKSPRSLSVLIPYVYAVILFFLVLSTWEYAYQHTFVKFYNASNWVEVVAKI
jgi:hypothetical protein